MAYRLSCVVADEQLGTIISTIQGCVTDLRIEPTGPAPKAKPVLQRSTSGSRPVSETRTGRLLLEAMAKQLSPFSTADGAAVLEANSFQGSGATPILSKLVAEGKVSRVGSGLYRLNGE